MTMHWDSPQLFPICESICSRSCHWWYDSLIWIQHLLIILKSSGLLERDTNKESWLDYASGLCHYLHDTLISINLHQNSNSKSKLKLKYSMFSPRVCALFELLPNFKNNSRNKFLLSPLPHPVLCAIKLSFITKPTINIKISWNKVLY